MTRPSIGGDFVQVTLMFTSGAHVRIDFVDMQKKCAGSEKIVLNNLEVNKKHSRFVVTYHKTITIKYKIIHKTTTYKESDFFRLWSGLMLHTLHSLLTTPIKIGRRV